MKTLKCSLSLIGIFTSGVQTDQKRKGVFEPTSAHEYSIKKKISLACFHLVPLNLQCKQSTSTSEKSKFNLEYKL